MLVMLVIDIGVQGHSGAFSNGAEHDFAEAGQFPHRVRDITGRREVAAVVSGFENDTVVNPLDFLSDKGRVFLGGDGLHRGRLHFLFGNASGFQRVGAATEVASQRVNVHAGDFGRCNGLADSDFHQRPLFVEQFVDEADGPDPAVNFSQPVEIPGIGAVKIDGHHRQAGLFDQFDDIGSPGLVLDDGPAADSRAGILFLVGGHLSGREKADGTSVCDVFERSPDAVDAAGVSLSRQVVHRQKSFFQIGNEG